MEQPSKIALVAGAAVAALLYCGYLIGSSPTSEECFREIVFQAAGAREVAASPLPDAHAGTRYNPVAAGAAAGLAEALSSSTGGRTAAVVLLHLVNIAAAAGALARVIGPRAGIAGALIFGLHPLHAALLASPLGGLQPGITVLSVLLCLLAAGDFERTGRWRALVVGPLCAMLAGLSTDQICVPLIVTVYALILPRAVHRPHSARIAAFHLAVWVLWGMTAALRSAVFEIAPRLALDLAGLFDVLAAAPFVRAPAGGPLPWLIVGLPAAAVVLRTLLHGWAFPKALGGTLLLLLTASLQLRWHAGAGVLVEDAAVPLLFAAAAAGLVAAGSTAARGRPAPSAAAAAGLGLACALAGGTASVFLLNTLEAAGGRARSAVDAIRRDLLQSSAQTVFLFNEPVTVRLGRSTAAEFFKHDLVQCCGEGSGVSAFFPTHGHPTIDEDDKVILYLTPGAIAYAVDHQGGAERFFADRLAIDAAFRVVSGAINLGVLGGDRAVFRRNGLAFSLFSPRDAARLRAVLLTPLGPCVDGCFDPAMRYPTGRETYLFNTGAARDRLRLARGCRLLLWVDAVSGDGSRLRRSANLFFWLEAVR